MHWWWEEDNIIFWSCKEGSKEEEELRKHDEAALIFFKTFGSAEQADEAIRKYQSLAAKYLSTALLEKIHWLDPNNKSTLNIVEIPAECSLFQTKIFNEFYKIIGGIVVLMICLTVFFHREKTIYKMCNRKRKIHPIT